MKIIKTKKELEIENKRRSRVILTLGILIGFLLINYGYEQLKDFKIQINKDNNTEKYCQEQQNQNNILNSVKGFTYGVLELKYPFFVKFLIFLGIVYFIIIALSVSGDVFSMLLIVVTFTYRGFRRIFKKDKNGKEM